MGKREAEKKIAEQLIDEFSIADGVEDGKFIAVGSISIEELRVIIKALKIFVGGN